MNSTCERGHRSTGALQPYPDYKDSGVEWLGAVPAHWEVRRLRNVSTLRVSNIDKHTREGEVPVRLCNYVDVYKNDRIRSGMAFMAATATADEVEQFRLRSGDVLITKDSEVWNDIGVPALVQEIDDDVVSGYHLALLQPDAEHIEGGFLFRAIEPRCRTSAPRSREWRHALRPFAECNQVGPASHTSPGRTSRHHPIPRPRRPPHPALHPRQGETDRRGKSRAARIFAGARMAYPSDRGRGHRQARCAQKPRWSGRTRPRPRRRRLMSNRPSVTEQTNSAAERHRVPVDSRG